MKWRDGFAGSWTLNRRREFWTKLRCCRNWRSWDRSFQRVKDGACKEVIHKGTDVNLLDFPILKCWPQDGGRFITFPLVFTKNPENGKRNVGMYRMQVYDERTTGMHWQ